jgi:hypothetical protein
MLPSTNSLSRNISEKELEMKTMKRAIKVSCIFAAAWCLASVASPMAQAQVLDQTPSDALVVVKINHLADTNKKVSDLLAQLGVTDLVPTMKDPLETAETQLGIGPGLDTKRDAAAVVLNGTFEKDGPPPFVLLLPVSDYKAFLGSLTVVRTEGDVTVAHFKDNEDDAFIENWGDYAAISDKKDNVTVKHEGLKPTGLSKKQLDDKDFCVYVNFPVLKDVLIPKLKDGTDQATDQLTKTITDPAKLKLAQAALKQGIAMVTEFLNDAQGTTIGLSISDAGISSNMVVELTPDSYLGKLASSVKTTDGPLLTGLPKENYLFFGGSIQDPAALTKVVNDVLAPIMTELSGMGDDGKKLTDAIEIYKQALLNVEGDTFGVIAPTAALGQGSLLRVVTIYKGDAAKLQAAQLKVADVQNDMLKVLGFGNVDLMKTTVTPAFKTINGVKFDRVQSEVNPDNTSQEAMRMSEMLSQIYGPDGASGLIGSIDEKTLVASMGNDDDTISQVIDASKANKDVLTDDLKDVDANLPKTRAVVAYLGLDQIVSTALSYAKANGLNVGIQLPNNLPPIGFSAGTDGSALRSDMFIPTKLLQSMVQAGATMYQQFNNRGGGGGGL